MRLIVTIFFIFLLLPAFAQEGKKKLDAQNKLPSTGKNIENVIPSDSLTLRFEEQKGKLPLPVQGTVHNYKPPLLRGCNLFRHFGIDINVIVGVPVHAVFEGVVRNIVTVEGSQIVLLQHGNYFTAYNNLSSVSVSIGQHLGAMQVIGVAGDNEEEEPTINFQIWKSDSKEGNKEMKPELWLGGKYFKLKRLPAITSGQYPTV